MRKVICENCGAEFNTAAPNVKYCSLDCREAGRMKRRAEWEQARPTYNRDYKRTRSTAGV